MDAANATPSQTLGQLRVKAEFNPEKKETVDLIKNTCAQMIDIALKGRDKDIDMTHLQTQFQNIIILDSEQSENSEKNRLVKIAWYYMDQAMNNWRSVNYGNDDHIDLVSEKLETACMYAVKWYWTT